jgi:hypothetical protein
MASDNAFYNRIIRKIVVGFGNIFDNITMVRYNTNGTENQRFKVPLIYSSKEKYVSRLVGDPDLDKKIQIALPRMSFDLLGMSYDSTRKQITNIKNYSQSGNPQTALAQYVPVPYNFDFNLYIYVRNIEDGTQIIEHILPYFTPDYTIKLNLVPSMNITKEIPILLNKVDYSVEFEGDRDSSTRIVVWTLSFTVKGFIYGPTNEIGIIKTVIANIDSMQSDPNVGMYLSTVGFGAYKIGETVYQGYSLDSATATAQVVSYNSTLHEIYITNIQGEFVAGSQLIGDTTNSEFVLESIINSNNRLATVTVTTDPTDANSSSNFAFVTTIEEI